MPRELSFTSGGERCAARLYEPEHSEEGSRGPLVLMAQGFSLTQADGLDLYGEAFAAAGLAAMSFDYRHFGDSDGRPRRRFRQAEQRADWLAAYRFAAGLDLVDPDQIVVWGYSFGAGHLTALLASHRIEPAAAIMVAPFVDGFRRIQRTPPGMILRLLPPTLLDAVGITRMIPVTGRPSALAAMNLPGEEEGFERAIPSGSPWRNEVSAGVFATVAFHRPWKRAGRIDCPLWVGLGTADVSTDPASVRGLALRARRGELHRYPIDHFEPMVGEFADQIAADQIAFLGRLGLSD